MCPFGGLLSGYLLDKVGRKKTLYFINIISIVSWAIMSFASRTDSATLFIQLIVARIIIGTYVCVCHNCRQFYLLSLPSVAVSIAS